LGDKLPSLPKFPETLKEFAIFSDKKKTVKTGKTFASMYI
jgi:hypothetical protein